MSKTLNYIKLNSSKEDHDIIRNEFFVTNIQRIKIYSLLAIPVSLLHILLFAAKIDPENTAEYYWRIQIILMHTILVLVATAFGIYAWVASKKRQSANRFDLYIGPLFGLIIIISGALISAIDQKVTNSIIPFLIVSIIAALFLLIRPWIIFSIGMVALAAFSVLMYHAQPNQQYLLTNLVNGLTAIALAIGLSTILWISSLTRHRQSRLITRQKIELEASYRKLQEKTQELEQANSTKDRFFSILAHDLFGPIAGISSYMQFMEEEAQTNAWDSKQLLVSIHRFRDSVDNTLRLIENLLNWARTQRNEITFNPKSVDISLLLNVAADSLKLQCEKKGIAINIPKTPQTMFVDGDTNMLETVFRNLLSNAVKFSHPGNNIRVITSQSPELTEVKIIDNGVGMSPETVNKLFQIGEKITSRGTDYESGTGLGLVLVDEFIKHHQGRILVESVEGKGSTFTVQLPGNNVTGDE
jgi:signal transduction histidine kinase